MNALLKNLLQYQELCLSLREQKASSPKAGTKSLESSLQRLRGKIPQPLQSQLDLQVGKNPLILAPVVRGACTACRQTLPTSLDYSLRTSDSIHRCPGCGRILYIQDEPIRQTGKRAGSFFGKESAGISKYSTSALMIPQLAAKTRDEAIAELAQRLADEGYVEDADALAARAREREALASSAIDKGLAFPHVRGIEGGGLTVAMGLKRGGLDFDSPDSMKTKLIFFTVIPTAASQFYLTLLSALTQAFREAKARTQILACKTAEDMWDALGELTGEFLK